ncbi:MULTISPECIES: hypothetical protein [unclassified Hahella]|uniref:hypothetical protein n=1 Tax=unclassified Hahella TaxID=2624107 RepID=UPI001C1ED32A|nr:MULTISPECIES: hypothetical protein [unclassified Hahella]MBU6955703.1 hypothetical protein [Hahella sp. HN01]MDG9671354.1 hypothetical protein [Hahella sp. CR1]
MPVFAYQSLNSNASSDHGVSASNSQHFTRMTHDHSATNHQGPWLLVPPTNPNVEPHELLHGPSQMISTASAGKMNKGQHDNASFRSLVEGKARLNHQHLGQAFGQSCDLMVFGELNSEHAEWATLKNSAGPIFKTSTPAKACNCFSVHATNNSQHRFVGDGQGWIAIKSYGVLAVFVHVPNSVAKSADAAKVFYGAIRNQLLQSNAGVIDIIMGDTNQGSNDFTHTVVSEALGQTFADAHTGSSIQPFDAHNREFQGTNSTGTKKYDVAVYNTQSVRVNRLIYLSQFAPTSHQSWEAVAITDHMGIGVEVERI